MQHNKGKYSLDEDFKNWLETRPEIIRQLAKEYPPGQYIMKKGAPYGISCEGTKVYLHGYHEDGQISVIVKAEDKTPAAIEHEVRLCELHGKDKEKVHKLNVQVIIDPKWIQPIDRAN